MAVLKRVALLLLLILLLLLALLAYITMTHGGMQRLFSLGQSYAAGELVVGKSTGALIGPATFEDVSYVNESGASVKIDSARFDWRPKKLLSRAIQVDDLSLQGIDIYLPAPTPKQKESQPFQLRDLALPISADVKNVQINDLNIYPYGADKPFVIDEIRLSAEGQESSLRLVDLQVASPQLDVSMTGSLDTSGDWPLDLKPVWRFKHEKFGEFEGSGRITGTTRILEVTHKVSGPVAIDVEAQVNDVTAELSWVGNIQVQSDDLGVFSPAVSGLPLTISADSTGSLSDYSVQGDLKTRHPITGELNSDFKLRGNLQELLIDQLALEFEDSPSALTAQGQVTLADLHSDITVNWQDLRWPLSQAEPLVTLSPTGELRITGVPEDLQVVTQANVNQPGVGEVVVNADVNNTAEQLTINALTLDTETQKSVVSVSGEIDIAQNRTALSGTLNQFTWPLSEESDNATVGIPNGSFSLNGPFDDYRLTTDLTVEGAQVPEGQWKISGRGDTQQLKLLSINGNTLAGEITGRGEVSWNPRPLWQIDLQGDSLNPEKKWPGLQGNIGFLLSSSGEVGDNGLAANTQIKDINGSYRDQVLSGSGAILIDNGITSIRELEIKAGAASLDANGTIGETLDIKWNVKAPAIGKLLPQVKGGVDLSGVVVGEASSPSARFSLSLDNIVADAISIKKGQGSGTVDISGGEKSEVSLTLNEVSAGGQNVSEVKLNGKGTPENHSVEITADSDLVDLAFNATGAVKDGGWQGSIEQLGLKDTEVGDWVLQQPVPVSANAQRVDASGLCLASKPGTVCIDTLWDAKDGVQSKVDISSLDTLRFKKYLPPDITLDALVDGSINVSAAPGESPVVKGDLSLPGGKLDYLDAGEPRTSQLGKNTISFDFANDNLSSRLNLDLGDIGTISSVANIAQLSGAKNLSGSVKTDLKDLALFSAFAPGMDSFKGSLNTQMKLAGSVDAPKVIGDSDLDALVLEVPSVAMKLIDGKIVARSDGKGGLLLSGSATSGDGQIALEGSFDPATQDADVTIKGENFQVANAKNQRLLVSPDLRVIKKGEDITVRGKVHVPSAFYQAGAEAALIKESPDVVLVNAGEQSEAEKAASRMTIDVEVTLGDDIRVKAGQFNGALGGAVTIEQQPGGVPTGVGAIEVLNGDFLVYGQKLTMENGRILFGGGPVTNPALEIDVARDVPAYEVKAGARIRGTAQAPLLELQSDPAQTDANTLSYILLGRPVSSAGVSYTLGKYITPDLYVSYGIDLISKTKTYNLRYKFTELLSLVAAKSDVSSADLIYTFER